MQMGTFPLPSTSIGSDFRASVVLFFSKTHSFFRLSVLSFLSAFLLSFGLGVNSIGVLFQCRLVFSIKSVISEPKSNSSVDIVQEGKLLAIEGLSRPL